MILLGEKNAKIENHFMQNLYFSLFFSNFAPLLIVLQACDAGVADVKIPSVFPFFR